MKTILSLLFALTLGTAFGQFIPQPMGYNPDVNGDEFIGVDDVMGTLALYDNAFDNGDSVVTVFADLTDPLDTLFIPANTDMVYINADGPENPHFLIELPSGTGFKTLVVMAKNTTEISGSTASIRFIEPCDYGDGFCTVQWIYVTEYKPLYTFLIRGLDGVWYSEETN
jgi:hypothetical protein